MTTDAFSEAVQAITTGDEVGLRALLQAHPGLIKERSPQAHRATLLHYIGANGVETQCSPPNAPEIARILLTAGAEVDALAPIYGTPAYDTALCLTVTSCVPFVAGVQTSIVDTLLDFGAMINGVADDGAPLGCALMFGYTGAAEVLAMRGARVDNLVYAAGLGQTELVRSMLADGNGTGNIPRRSDDKAGRFSFPLPRDADALEVAMIVAAMHGRLEAMRLLLDSGIDVDAAPYCRQSALHYAAHMGRFQIVDELLRRGARASVADTQMNLTPAQWALESGKTEMAQRLTRQA